MAAPIKEVKRNEEVKVKLYPKEKEDLIKIFDNSAHANMSEMVRHVLFKKKIRVVSIDNELINRNALLIQQTRNIGKNFNQLLKLLHSKKLNYFTTSDVNNIVKNLEDIKKTYNAIEEYFKVNGR